MLSHTAWLSEEIQRASEEKVNLAQAAYDSVYFLIPRFLLSTHVWVIRRLIDIFAY